MTNKEKGNNTKRSIEQVKPEDEQGQAETQTDDVVDEKQEGVEKEGNKEVKPASKKRKTESTEKVDVKHTPTSRRATRNSKTKTSPHGPKEIVHFLVSDKAIEMLDQLKSGNDTAFHFPRDRHRVATHAISGLFNNKHLLKDPKDVLEFGYDKMYGETHPLLGYRANIRLCFSLESLHRSKTLHKDKTTGQIIGIAKVCQSSFNGSSSLSSLREQASHDPAKERDLIVKSFKGYGPKTVDIFFRRAQVDWEEVYPFADAATIKAAREVGLEVDDAQGLKKVVDEAMEEKDDEKERLAFGRVVDVLVYLGLEKKTDQVESQIGKA
ncbi:hypothetical protein QFC22_001628 [Naganishia vaughanmartiniae]|uniref:Uncharacterized protein n=1 Tax=Naganishia vaughanmartiniae TaxID=1424756 RepID=A0ACC2XIH1_9TREE|nr:hypothetical protein QFC22_001628 [Naganishia vaughanmartiniae]